MFPPTNFLVFFLHTEYYIVSIFFPLNIFAKHKFCGGQVTKLCPILATPWTVCSLSGSSLHWNSPGKNIGVGCHFLLQEIFPTQKLTLSLLHCRQIIYQLNYKGISNNITFSNCIKILLIPQS